MNAHGTLMSGARLVGLFVVVIGSGCFKSQRDPMANGPDAAGNGGTKASPRAGNSGDPASAAGRGESTDLPAEAGSASDAGAAGEAGEAGAPSAGSGGTGSAALPTRAPWFTPDICVNGGYCSAVDVANLSDADILFVVDNSGSMVGEQAALRTQFPRLITALTGSNSGERFVPLRNLHLGVVSTDMGLVGVPNSFPGCNTQRHIHGGDDGVLQHPGDTGPDCAPSYPPFISFERGVSDPAQTAADFGCIASLGTSGCGFEQQLEAGLKALWPKNYIDEHGQVYPPQDNPIVFLATTEEGRYGHGDIASTEGGNGGFLRDSQATPSLVVVVVVTDEEDCSARSTDHFISTNDPANPLSKQGPNLRCFYNKQNLFDIVRYVQAFKQLRAGREDLVVFGAIAGVPVDLVNDQARRAVDFTDAQQSDAYYDRILSDERMLEVPVNEETPAISNLTPSCMRQSADGTSSLAYPPRRIVEVAKGFGANGFVQSICQDDLEPAIDGMIDTIRPRMDATCLPAPLERRDDGKVRCSVIWQLPPADQAASGVPTECSERPFLKPVQGKLPRVNSHGGRNCEIDQLAVQGSESPAGEGFYYDDVSQERLAICPDDQPQRVAFSAGAKPPAEIGIYIDCTGA